MTIDIAPEKLREAMRIMGVDSPKDAIERALDFCVQHRPRDQRHLISMLGTFVDFMTPQELEESRSLE